MSHTTHHTSVTVAPGTLPSGNTRRGFTLWLTGLSGAGKSTLAGALAERLRADGAAVEVLDGDEVREHLSKGLTFSREDRDLNVRRIAYVAKLLCRNGVAVITAAILVSRSLQRALRRRSWSSWRPGWTATRPAAMACARAPRWCARESEHARWDDAPRCRGSPSPMWVTPAR